MLVKNPKCSLFALIGNVNTFSQTAVNRSQIWSLGHSMKPDTNHRNASKYF